MAQSRVGTDWWSTDSCGCAPDKVTNTTSLITTCCSLDPKCLPKTPVMEPLSDT